MSRARSVADLGNQSLNLGISDGGLTIGTGVTIENTGKSQFAGIVTASQFVGDGSGLTGVTGTGSGVVIQEEGTNVGTASTINFVGSAVTAAISGGVATVEISSSGGGGGDTVSINATATDILSVSSGDISADDAGADKLVFWDDSAGKLTYLTVGSNLTVTDTTIASSGGGGGSGISNVVEDTTPQLGGNLDLNSKDITGTGNANITGVVTATTFSGSGASLTSIPAGQLTGTVADARLTTVSSSKLSGALPALDGSALTGVTATGSGVVIKHDDSVVGTAATINFGTNLDVSALSAGIVTVTASGSSGISSIFEDTTPRLSGDLDANSKNITGISSIDSGSGELFVKSDIIRFKKHDDTESIAVFNSDGPVNLFFDGSKKFETTSTGAEVFGDLTATSFSGSGASLTGVVTSITAGSNITLTGGPTGAITIAASGGGGGSDVTTRSTSRFVATAAQSAFSTSYTVGYVDVFLNGSKLDGTEYAATNGSSVSLTTAAAADDIVEIVAYETIGITSISSATQGLNVTGIITATGGIDAIGIQSGGVNISTGIITALNFIGAGNTFAVNGNVVDISIAGGGGGGISNVVEDTTPQLGGNLDLNSKDITGTGNANITGVVTATTFSGSGASLTSIPAGQLTGTIADARFPATLPAVSGVNLTGVVTSITAGSNITLTGGPTGAITIAASGGGGSSGPDPVIMGMIF